MAVLFISPANPTAVDWPGVSFATTTSIRWLTFNSIQSSSESMPATSDLEMP